MAQRVEQVTVIGRRTPPGLLRLPALVRILDRSASSNLAGRVLIYLSGAAVLAVSLGALAVLDAERGAPEANISTFGDALWWGKHNRHDGWLRR